MSSSLQEQLQRALGDVFLLERELGGGGMSRVFLATELALGRHVVVKVLLPELAAGVNVERFRREIQLAAQLQHPHIVPLLSAGEAQGLPYFIMPFVSGESLRTRVTREGELPIPGTIRILRDVVSALAYAHERGIVHRDVKPDNVLLSSGVAVVTDFGVAKAVSASSGAGGLSSLTSLGVALGTPAYMAPEQATATPNTDHRAYIYALGVVAYEMLTGAPPFSGRSMQQVLAAHVVEEPEPVERRRPAVSPLFATLIRDCLAKRPADRPQTAIEILNVLDAIATPSGGTVATTAVRIPVGAGRADSVRRSRATLVGSSIAFALLLAGVFWLRRSEPATNLTTNSSVSDPVSAVLPPADSVNTRIRPEVGAGEMEQKPERITEEQRPVRTPPAPPRARDPVPTRAAPKPPAVESTVPAPVAVLPTPAPAVSPVESAPVTAAAPAQAPAPSPPPRPVDPLPEIRRVVAEYARAIESESLGELRRAYPGMTPIQERGWEQFFQLVRDVETDLSVARLNRSNSAAEAQVTGIYTYLNTSTGRVVRQPVSFQAAFSNQTGKWRISEVR